MKELKTLAELRNKLEKSKKEYQTLKEAFVFENAKLIGEIEALELDLENEEGIIRQEAIAQFNTTGLKAFENGVKIRMVQKLTYDDLKAFEWANTHHIALSLDKKAFEKIAKASPLDFVEYKEEPQATIPTEITL